MKAVVFRSFGDADVLEIVDIDSPTPMEDEVLIKVRAAAINPKDIFVRKGYFKERTGTDFPMRTGFDFAGEVVGKGSQVQGFETGLPVYGMLDGWGGGACAQYIAVKVHQLSQKPDNLSFEEAAALPLVFLTAMQALRDEAGIRAGSQVCINGASGGVGSMAVQIAKRFGATVAAIGSAVNHSFLETLGADICYDYHQTDITNSRRRFDIFFDVFGNRLFETVEPVLSEKGVWVSTVLRPEVLAAVDRTKDAPGKKARLVIVRPDNRDLATLRQWVETGVVKPVIQDVFPMEKIADAHRRQATKHTRGKLVVAIP